MLGIARLVAVALTVSIIQSAIPLDVETGGESGVDLPSPTMSQCSALSSWSDCSDSAKSPDGFVILTPPLPAPPLHPGALSEHDDSGQSTDEEYGNALAHQLAQALKRKSVRSIDAQSSCRSTSPSSMASDDERRALLGVDDSAGSPYGTCQVAMIRLNKVDEEKADQGFALPDDPRQGRIVGRSRSIAGPLHSSGDLSCNPPTFPDYRLYAVQRTDQHLREYSRNMEGVNLRAYKRIILGICFFALFLIIVRLIVGMGAAVPDFSNSTVPYNITMADHEQLPRAILHLYRQARKMKQT